jgi:NADH-quinone oxidoreductase subunit L
MVAAGIYMLCRIEMLMVPDALTVIMWTGTATALYAALCAIVQSDIKKVLAYSTLSQLGYMVAAFGLGSLAVPPAWGPPHGHRRRRRRRDVPPHDPRLLQGAHVPRLRLRHPRLPPRAGHLQDGRAAEKDAADVLTFTIGVAAIIGFPCLAGFFSKDAILYLAMRKNTAVFASWRHRRADVVLHGPHVEARLPRRRPPTNAAHAHESGCR